MSLKDLREAGVLLPQEEWGTHDLHSTVNRPALLLTGLLGVAAIASMYLGGGRTLTFIGAGLFVVFMGCITYLSLKAVDAQAARFEREHAEIAQDPSQPALPGQRSSAVSADDQHQPAEGDRSA